MWLSWTSLRLMNDSVYFHLARPARVNQEGGLSSVVNFSKQMPVLIWPAILSVCIFWLMFWAAVESQPVYFFNICLLQASLQFLARHLLSLSCLQQRSVHDGGSAVSMQQ